MNKKSYAASLFAVVLLCGSAYAQSSLTTSLTIFHNNDGESKLFGDDNFGGAAHFKTTLDDLRAANTGRDQLTISSGDNFLAGAAFNTSLNSGTPGNRTFYDGLALAEIGYDAITLGNHDFDFGPEILAEFITYYNNNGGNGTFLSANLDFSAEASLDALATGGSIAKSTVITRGTERYGIIGATTTDLDIVSNPGSVGINAVLPAIQAEVTALEGMGVNKIILSSHLQNLNNELSLVSQLSGIDVVIAGGGDELLLNLPNARNSLADRDGPYPLIRQDSDGKNVAVVTTVGEYFYVGELDVEFDANGDVVNASGFSGDARLVDKNSVLPDASIQTNIIDPLNNALAVANATQIATTDVFLEHNEGDPNGPRVIRDRETNLGNLVADAFVWSVEQAGEGLTPGNKVVGIANSGGIRDNLDDNVDGIITQGEAQAVLPFFNLMAVLGGADADVLAAMLENSVSALPGNGRFAQISGIEFTYDRTAPAGDRVREVRLDDGTVIWTETAGALTSDLFDIATNSFLAGGGDGYADSIIGLPVELITSQTYADALIGYLTADPSQGGLGGVVSGLDYPLAGAGRIVAIPEPASLLLTSLAVVLVCRGRSRS